MAWWHRAVVGQKVVCINPDWVPGYGYDYDGKNKLPVKGTVYTILCFTTHHLFKEGVGVCLEEIGLDDHFGVTGFRPVKDTSKQVEALKRLCNLTPEQKQLETAREGRS